MSWKRLWFVALLVAVVVGGMSVMLDITQVEAQERRSEEAARLMGELMSGRGPVVGAFALEDQYGRIKSLSDFRGALVLLYFGYVSCPDVCPADLAAMAELLKALGSQGDSVQPIFVTLDPARDTAEILRSYAAAFHPRLVALRGSEEDVRRVANDYKVFVETVRPPGTTTYVIDHMAFIFLLDREGRYVSFFPPGTSAKRMKPVVLEMLAN